ncbi:hypothetical protein CHARACLAT_023741 [Characodon lateralis]|uniref:Kit ligand n=3 Tax=Goodeidae TaxID=28758 RepID=A0ABU7D9G2_9TELE|nr:hypothetical protein [Characodon lateralis]
MVTQLVGGLSTTSKDPTGLSEVKADCWPILGFHYTFGHHLHTYKHAQGSEFFLQTQKAEFHELDLRKRGPLLHMRKKIISTTCVLLGLFSSLHLCSGKFGTPITDDVSKLSILKQNIPTDYEIPVSYIPKEVAGTCWVVLNIYPLEESLRNLASLFGAMSSNKDNIIVFIAMLKSLRFTFDHEELEEAMQVFQCHYQKKSLVSGLYFDYIQDLLHAATQGTSSFSCKPPPCLNHQQTPEGQEESRKYSWLKRSALLLVLIPFTACVVLIVWQVKSGPSLVACKTSNGRTASPDMIPTVSVSIPLQALTHAADCQATGEAISEHESG